MRLPLIYSDTETITIFSFILIYLIIDLIGISQEAYQAAVRDGKELDWQCAVCSRPDPYADPSSYLESQALEPSFVEPDAESTRIDYEESSLHDPTPAETTSTFAVTYQIVENSSKRGQPKLKLVRHPFTQLLTINAFVRKDDHAKQVFAGVRPHVWQKEEGLSCSKYSVIYSVCILIDYFYCTSETNFMGSFQGLGEITLIFQVQKITKDLLFFFSIVGPEKCA